MNTQQFKITRHELLIRSSRLTSRDLLLSGTMWPFFRNISFKVHAAFMDGHWPTVREQMQKAATQALNACQ